VLSKVYSILDMLNCLFLPADL